MLPYPDLTDEDIDALLVYIENPNGVPVPAEEGSEGEDEEEAIVLVDADEDKTSFFKSNLFYILLMLLAAALTAVLAKTVADLKNKAEEKEFGEAGNNGVLSVLFSRPVMKFAMFAFLVFGLFHLLQLSQDYFGLCGMI